MVLGTESITAVPLTQPLVEETPSRRRTNGKHSQRPIWLGEDKRVWDHIRCHLQVIKDPRINAYDLAVYMGLLAHADTGNGLAYPSYATLASYGQISEQSVRRSVGRLVALKYIEVSTLRGKANRFTILPPPDLPLVDTPTPEEGVSEGPLTVGYPTPYCVAPELEPGNEITTTTNPQPPGESNSSPSLSSPLPSQQGSPEAHQPDSQIKALLDAFCRGSGLKPVTPREAARWTTGAQQLAQIEGLTPEKVEYAARAQQKAWAGTAFQVTPASLANNWRKFSRRPKNGAHGPDWAPYMDLNRQEVPPERLKPLPLLVPADQSCPQPRRSVASRRPWWAAV